MPAASLRALLAQSIDYAGLFPPCSLDLETALKNHAQYVRSADNWMLGAFILPVEKFEGAAASFSQFDHKHPLRISALGPKAENAKDFRGALQSTVAAIKSFAAQHVDLVAINQLEMALPENVDLALLTETDAMFGEMKLNVFWETPADAAEETIALLAQHHKKNPRVFGYKLRTGGVTADAFPLSTQIATALIAATRHHVPIKFTAGLHHPVHQFRKEVETKMHGFLNVLGAGVLVAEHDWDERQTIEMLEDEDAASFSFEDTVFAWRDWEVAIDRIKARRKFVTSFGSCSFDEPREDLRALGLLPS
ncbi:MAG: hypothetical protein QOI04_1096 [Verrucomicrobiota bacterium]|jgi:hypothetical protein